MQSLRELLALQREPFIPAGIGCRGRFRWIGFGAPATAVLGVKNSDIDHGVYDIACYRDTVHCIASCTTTFAQMQLLVQQLWKPLFLRRGTWQ